MPILYMLCGPSASGKSTWAHNFISKNLQKDIRYVSRDEIRFSLLKENEKYFAHEKQVFKKFAGTITQTLVDGFDVIADATHLNIFSRKKLTNAIDKIYTDYQIIYVIFDIPLQDILSRNQQRLGLERVPEEEIKRMYNDFSPPIHEDNREIDRCIVKE